MKLIMGDQSPWTKGLLRLRAVELMFPEAEEIAYFWHDADQSWVPIAGLGFPEWKPKRGENYCSISLSALTSLNEDIRQSLSAPLVEIILIGPNAATIIWWQEKELAKFVSKKLDHIVKWYTFLGGSFQIFPSPAESRPLLSWIRCLSKKLNCRIVPGSIVEYFQKPEIQAELLSWSSDGDSWVIKEGRRLPFLTFPFNIPENAFIIPRRDGLVRFFLKKGWRFVGSNIPYLQPDVDYFQIHLEIFEEDRRLLEDKIWSIFKEKKLAAGKSVKERPAELLPRTPDVLSKLALGYRVRAWTNDGREVTF